MNTQIQRKRGKEHLDITINTVRRFCESIVNIGLCIITVKTVKRFLRDRGSMLEKILKRGTPKVWLVEFLCNLNAKTAVPLKTSSIIIQTILNCLKF
jgi:hypothetical protein